MKRIIVVALVACLLAGCGYMHRNTPCKEPCNTCHQAKPCKTCAKHPVHVYNK